MKNLVEALAKKFGPTLLVAAIIGTALLGGCVQERTAETPTTVKEIPETTSAVHLKEVEPTKKKEKVPEKFFPTLLSWRLFKRKEV